MTEILGRRYQDQDASAASPPHIAHTAGPSSNWTRCAVAEPENG